MCSGGSWSRCSRCWPGAVRLSPGSHLSLPCDGSLAETEEDVEPAFWADGRGEARWDTLTLWTMVVAGVLLIADASSWAYFGLIGGGMYLYFGGRIIFTRVAMQRRDLRIGAQQNVRLGYIFGAVWAAMALITIVASIASLEG